MQKLREDPAYRAMIEAERKAKQEKEEAEARAIAEKKAKEDALSRLTKSTFDKCSVALEQVRKTSQDCRRIREQFQSVNEGINLTC